MSTPQPKNPPPQPSRPAHITVVIACKDAAHVLPHCLDSLAAQTLLPHQIILKDAGSADGTHDLPARYPTLPIRLVVTPDAGIYDAWNQALAEATGDWILFLGADDTLATPDILARSAAALADVPPELEVAYGQLLLEDPDGRPLARLGQPWAQVARAMRHRMVLPHPATFHRASLFQRIGLFDPAFRIAGDYDLLLRATNDRGAVYLEGLTVTRMREGGVSSLPSNNLALAREMSAIVGRHGEKGPGFYALMGRYVGTWALGKLLGDRLTMRLRGWAGRMRHERVDHAGAAMSNSAPPAPGVFISVVTVCRNPGRSLQGTLQSVREQSGVHFEHLVIDGASTDGTPEFLAGLADPRLRVLSEPDTGIYDAMNKAIRMARGEWILFLNAGDAFDGPGSLAALARHAKDGVDHVAARMFFRWADGRVFPCSPKGIAPPLIHMPVFHQATLTRTERLRRSPFDASYRIAGDMDFFLGEIRSGATFAFIPDLVSRFDAGGVSSTRLWQTHLEARRAILHHTRFSPVARIALECRLMIRLVVTPVFAAARRASAGAA